jgi:hypothetical protein
MKKLELQEIIKEELQNALNEINDPAQDGFDDAMGRAGITFATGTNRMKEREYEVVYWYRYKDIKDLDMTTVMARSEEEAIEKAKKKVRDEGVGGAIGSSFVINKLK